MLSDGDNCDLDGGWCQFFFQHIVQVRGALIIETCFRVFELLECVRVINHIKCVIHFISKFIHENVCKVCDLRFFYARLVFVKENMVHFFDVSMNWLIRKSSIEVGIIEKTNSNLHIAPGRLN